MESSTYLRHSENRDLREFLAAVVAVEIFIKVFFLESKVYDLSTAMFFAFSLGFLARGKFLAFYILYPLACLNRETTLLLSVFFAVYFFRKLPWNQYLAGLIYQGAVFIGTRWMVMKIFEENPGTSFYFSLLYVLRDYGSHPSMTLGLLALITPAVYFVAIHWKDKPIFLRYALLILLPLLLVAHLSMGMAFEIRVLAEVFPVAWALGLWKKL